MSSRLQTREASHFLVEFDDENANLRFYVCLKIQNSHRLTIRIGEKYLVHWGDKDGDKDEATVLESGEWLDMRRKEQECKKKLEQTTDSPNVSTESVETPPSSPVSDDTLPSPIALKKPLKRKQNTKPKDVKRSKPEASLVDIGDGNNDPYLFRSPTPSLELPPHFIAPTSPIEEVEPQPEPECNGKDKSPVLKTRPAFSSDNDLAEILKQVEINNARSSLLERMLLKQQETIEKLFAFVTRHLQPQESENTQRISTARRSLIDAVENESDVPSPSTRMAEKDTPRSMLQAFIENVPTTAPVKRSRARTRSPEDRHFNETVPNQKRRRKSSLAVKKTPRSMIESYMHDHKTQTPFVRVLRRRSKTFTPITQSGDGSDVITPRTALEGFINNAPEETPVQRAVNESELDSESDIILPNETLHVTHSPIHNEDTGSITISQKERQNQHHITLQQFTQGMHNLTSAAIQTKEMMFSSDSEDTPEIPPDVTLDVLVDSLNSESDRSHMRMPQQDRRQNLNHITLEQFSQGLKEKIGSGSDAGVMGDDETEEEHSDIQTFRRGQRMSSRLSMGSLHTQVLERSMNSRSYFSPGKTIGDLTPSRRTPVRSPMVSLPVESNLTPSRRNLTPNKSKVDSLFIEGNFTPSKSIQNIKLTTDSDLTPSKRPLSLKESLLNQTDLTPSQRTGNLNRSKVPYESDFSPPSRTQIYSESALTPSRRTQIDGESDLTPSQRTQIISESDLTPSRRTQIVSEPDLTLSQRSQIVSRSSTLHEHEELTPYRKTLSKNSISSNVESDLTPSRRTENPNRSTTFQSPKTSDLTPSRRTENLHKSTTLQSPDKCGLTPSRRRNTLDTSSSVHLTESNATLSRTMPTNTTMEAVKTNESGETDGSLQGESGETESNLSHTADKPAPHDDFDKSGSTQSHIDTSQKRQTEDHGQTPSHRSGLTQSHIDTSQSRQTEDHGQTPSHRSPEKALNSLMPSSDTSLKNNQKSQNRTKDILMSEQVEQDSTDEKTPRSQIRSQSKLKAPIRTPLSSNLTILENIKPLSSSTPARILKNKQIGTPSRVPVTPSSGSTPKRVPLIGSSMSRTPGRIPVKNSSMNISNNAKLSGTQNKSVRNQTNLEENMTNSALLSKNSSLRKLSHKSVNVSRQAVSDRLEADESKEETGEELDTIELYKLKTPHLRGDISQIPTPIYSSTPAPVKHVQKQLPRPIPQRKLDTKKNNANKYNYGGSKTNESGETDGSLQGESGETESNLSHTADKPAPHDDFDKSGSTQSHIDTSQKRQTEDHGQTPSHRSGLTQSHIDTSQSRQTEDHGQTPSHRSPEKALNSLMPSSDTSLKNNQKSQNRTKDILMSEQVEQDSTDEKTPRSQIRSQSKLKAPIRTPLSSNLTILENIKAFISSTPARILKINRLVHQAGYQLPLHLVLHQKEFL
ncbi:unnamed protein product [Mytilus coruscus]|uniref:Uncharacterized protein n=1 Tax=Mytilus coruscus TaxID=42192 RepID=A0A6J7ZSH7_MYTCO|nr:unnamed protein product [Mytilus coruscus]